MSSSREDFQRRIASGDASLRLYAILDAESCVRFGYGLMDVAKAWHEAGVSLVQYRDKQGRDDEVLANALQLKAIFDGSETLLILNDRVPLLPRRALMESMWVRRTLALRRLVR